MVTSLSLRLLDHVYDVNATTHQIFNDVVEALIQTALEGINATVFAYGQTASGKTYTIRGTEESPGIIPLSIRELFSRMEAAKDRKYSVRVSFFELYNEKINDLLDESKCDLDVRENLQGFYVNQLTEKDVASVKDAIAYLRIGDTRKKVAETCLNDTSSRSHTVFRLTIESRSRTGHDMPRCSQFNLVDLAGSEAVSRTHAEGTTRRYPFMSNV
jgi:centromeric protein E